VQALQTLTYGRAVEKKGNAKEDAHAECEDEGPPATPAQGAPVTRRPNERCEDEAKDGTQEPGETVVLLREACGDTELRAQPMDMVRVRTHTHTHTHTHTQSLLE
jgi:hypothetical protein